MKERGLHETIVKKNHRAPLVALAKKYLVRHGYMRPCKDPDTRLCPHISRALHQFQTFYKLEPTADPTLETLKLLRKRRCPMPDFEPGEAGGPGIEDSDPFVFSGSKWNKTDLRWFFKSGTADMTDEASIIQQAFDIWAGYIPLTFTPTIEEGGADLVVSWEVGDHGDGSPFDGEGSVLAHAFYPTDGRIHFDDSEDWNTDLLLATALHEIGHALGLKHSGSDDAVMYAYIDEDRHSLHEFDIRGIKSRYPRPHSSSATDFVRVHLWGLKSKGGTDAVTVDLGRTVRVLAWGQVTMLDPLSEFDRDNAYTIDVFEVDGERTDSYVYGGAHWGSDGAPCNAYTGAWVGRAQRVTFRMSAIHTHDLDAFGVGNIIILD
jgi:hypothetical protein